jgi:hypothetical protein
MIVVRLKGGTGNQMFQYALGFRLATELGCELLFDLSFLESREHDALHVRREYSLDIFGINGPFYEGNIHSGLEWVIERSFRFDPDILPDRGNILLDGYWQTDKYFAPVADAIWKCFSICEAGCLNPGLVQAFRDPNAVCINVRRGDFVENERSRNFHGVLGMDYLRSGVARIAPLLETPHFYVFSDDVAWCRENIRLDYPVQVIGHEHAGIKFRDYLHYMSLFRNYIIPNSSFAWWAVWLSDYPERNRRVVAPKQWFLDESYCFDDLIPPHWIRIDSDTQP